MRNRTRLLGLVILSVSVVATLVAVALSRVERPPVGEGLARLPIAGDSVALIKLAGVITDQMVEPRRGGRENVYAQLRRAERDPSVRAVVLRVDSPGGSASASQALYEQVRRVSGRNKPVVVHFADIAASGGYYVGAAGDKIVSQPTAITGSIGVIITAVDLRGLYDKIGIRERVYKSGPYKDILSGNRDTTPEEEAILQKLVQDAYDQFVKVVSEGRKLPEAEVRRIADGRIISGVEALRLGLVDEVGDQHRAVQLAGELAGLRGEPRVVLYEQEQRTGLLGFLGVTLPAGGPLERVLSEPGISIRYEWRH
jgi:protease-4